MLRDLEGILSRGRSPIVYKASKIEDMRLPFADRTDAGQQLAAHLGRFAGEGTIVLGLARGGLAVAAEVARVLGAELDVLVARKVGAPAHPEYGVGAVAPLEVRYFDPQAVAFLGIRPDELERLAEREEAEVVRRLAAYRGDRPDLRLEGKTAILVDDGLATGVTAVAAALYARRLEAARVVLAVPVGSIQGCDLLSHYVDEVVCPVRPDPFYAVGQWYENFAQTSDEEVSTALQRGIVQ